jgi:hypothetical protein
MTGNGHYEEDVIGWGLLKGQNPPLGRASASYIKGTELRTLAITEFNSIATRRYQEKSEGS